MVTEEDARDAIEIMSVSLADVYRHDEIDDIAMGGMVFGMDGSGAGQGGAMMPRIAGGKKLSSMSKNKRYKPFYAALKQLAVSLESWRGEPTKAR